jgi:hypothetical protein
MENGEKAELRDVVVVHTRSFVTAAVFTPAKGSVAKLAFVLAFGR